MGCDLENEDDPAGRPVRLTQIYLAVRTGALSLRASMCLATIGARLTASEIASPPAHPGGVFISLASAPTRP